MLELVRDFFNEARRLFVEDPKQSDPTWQLIVYRVPQQRDQASCGVCVCVNASLLVRGRCLSYECDTGMQAWREWLFAVILSGCSKDPSVVQALKKLSK
jgi:Ulp1 family protease